MTLSADLDSARLTVALDVRHPLAALALAPTLAFARSMSLTVNWLPLTAPTLRPPGPATPNDDRGTRHRRHRAEAIAREIETYASAQGLVMRDWYRSPDAAGAHMGWLWMRDRQPSRLEAYLTGLFAAYWGGHLDPSSVPAVAESIASVGGDGAAFVAWAGRGGREALAAVEDDLGRFGLHQVPAYVVEGEVFYGRQHLPMIRYVLEGRSGAIPI